MGTAPKPQESSLRRKNKGQGLTYKLIWAASSEPSARASGSFSTPTASQVAFLWFVIFSFKAALKAGLKLGPLVQAPDGVSGEQLHKEKVLSLPTEMTQEPTHTFPKSASYKRTSSMVPLHRKLSKLNCLSHPQLMSCCCACRALLWGYNWSLVPFPSGSFMSSEWRKGSW